MDVLVYLNRLKNASDELMRLFTSEALFNGRYRPLSSEILIHDAELAVFYATSQDVDYKLESIKRGDYSVQDALDEKYQYWTNILERHDKFYSEIISQIEMERANFNGLLDSKCKEILQAIEFHQNTNNVPEDLISVTAGILEPVLTQKVFENELSEFHNNLLRVYSCGGIPCGWKGDFPKGSLLVYNRKP